MMNSFYFQHDYNAHTDIKLLFVRQKLGMEGYGIYWYILEQLAISGGKMPMKIIPVLSMQMQTPEAKVESVIKHFELFNIEDDNFFSARLMEQIDFRLSLSENGKKGAEKRWGNRLNDSPPIAPAVSIPISDPNAKERKGKERKEKEIFRKPIKEDLINYFAEIGYDDFTSMAKADKFFDYYESKGWLVGKAKMKDWKATCRNWKRNELEKSEELKPTTKITL